MPGPVTGRLSTSSSPAVCTSSPPMVRSSVLLPQPEAPTNVTNSLAPMLRSTLSSAWVGAPSNCLVRPRMEILGGVVMVMFIASAFQIEPREGAAVRPAEQLVRHQPDEADDDDPGEDGVGLQEALRTQDRVAQARVR